MWDHYSPTLGRTRRDPTSFCPGMTDGGVYLTALLLLSHQRLTLITVIRKQDLLEGKLCWEMDSSAFGATCLSPLSKEAPESQAMKQTPNSKPCCMLEAVPLILSRCSGHQMDLITNGTGLLSVFILIHFHLILFSRKRAIKSREEERKETFASPCSS